MLNIYSSFKKINKELIKIGYQIKSDKDSDGKQIYRLMEWEDDGYYGKNLWVECGIYYKKHEILNLIEKLFNDKTSVYRSYKYYVSGGCKMFTRGFNIKEEAIEFINEVNEDFNYSNNNCGSDYYLLSREEYLEILESDEINEFDERFDLKGYLLCI
ncbi:MAG TPA: hypothetical protein VNX01_15235 [Bacteroidia bacterium]|nr:hypothetical protein [Bacteroidia bacterium]